MLDTLCNPGRIYQKPINNMAISIPGLWLLFFQTAFAASVANTLPRRQTSTSRTFVSDGNPILSDGSVYSADPAPIVVNDTIYIISGRDEAQIDELGFTMNEWQIFETKTATPAGGDWTLHSNVEQPQTLFTWAEGDSAYASQIVEAADGKFYLYSPVYQANTTDKDPFAIGVAVSDNVLGPYTDAHPEGPIISQSVPSPGNSIQNIDPTVMIDTDGSVYIYWGTFGQLRGAQLDSDMITVKSDTITTIDNLDGFFEAPWLMKHNGTYYLVYAANNAGADSPCTPTSYHACIAYATASSPLGPWTAGGIALGIVSSTTSHPGVFEHPAGSGDYYLVYHTRDAVDGTHFRRSIAFDKLEFDDAASPPAIRKVAQTHRPSAATTPTRNIAPAASPSSVSEVPIQYWIAALNDGRVESSSLPPDLWSTYADTSSPASGTIVYTWNSTVELNGTAMVFFADQDVGANIGVPPPTAWSVEYLTEAGDWAAVANVTAFPVAVTGTPAEVGFDVISTKSIRATVMASGSGGQYGGVGVKEWFAFAPVAA